MSFLIFMVKSLLCRPCLLCQEDSVTSHACLCTGADTPGRIGRRVAMLHQKILQADPLIYCSVAACYPTLAG